MERSKGYGDFPVPATPSVARQARTLKHGAWTTRNAWTTLRVELARNLEAAMSSRAVVDGGGRARGVRGSPGRQGGRPYRLRHKRLHQDEHQATERGRRQLHSGRWRQHNRSWQPFTFTRTSRVVGIDRTTITATITDGDSGAGETERNDLLLVLDGAKPGIHLNGYRNGLRDALTAGCRSTRGRSGPDQDGTANWAPPKDRDPGANQDITVPANSETTEQLRDPMRTEGRAQLVPAGVQVRPARPSPSNKPRETPPPVPRPPG